MTKTNGENDNLVGNTSNNEILDPLRNPDQYTSGRVPFCARSEEKARTKWDGARCEKWNLAQNGTMADRFVRERVQITMFS